MNIENLTAQVIAEVLTEMGEEYVDELRDRLSQYDLEDSDLANNISFQINGNVLTIDMMEYATFVDEGRDAGSFPPPDAIYDWVVKKGLTLDDGTGDIEQDRKSLSYLIGRKIEQEGIEEKPFIQPTPEENIEQEVAERLEVKIVTELEK